MTDDMLDSEKLVTAEELRSPTSVDYVNNIMRAARWLADTTTAESELEDNRHNVKFAVIERIMRSDNQLTGKPHSFSSAEAAAGADEEYINYLERLRSATRERIIARGAYEAALAAARLREAVTHVG